MAQLIDSSVFIALERRRLPIGALLSSTDPDEPVAITSITASELLAGVHRADSLERRLRREAFVERVLETVPVLPFDLRAGRIHAQIWAQLMAEGQIIGAYDLLNAAIALAQGYDILTDNVREFQRVPGLRVRQPQW
ncbi:MAG: type II toxin-antitoxin system VapC family toxin [Chloroflexota bacterium]|nr:type II toxin-antitoxin system VapC family toxin [Chloroflexota bacterium]